MRTRSLLIILFQTIVVLFVFTPLTHAKQKVDWYQQNLPHNNIAIVGIAFNSENNGMAISDEGEIFRSTNAGNTWVKLNSQPFYFHLSTLQNLEDTIWIVSGNPGIHFSTDFGETWTSVLSDSSVARPISCVAFYSRVAGYCLDRYGRLFQTIDGGVTWKQIAFPTIGEDVLSWVSVNRNGAVAVFGTDPLYGGVISISIDSGASWSIMKSVGIKWRRSSLINDTTVVVVGLRTFVGGVIFQSENMGVNWRESSINSQYGFSDVCFLDSRVGYIVGDDGVIVRTDDGGQSWRFQVAPTTNSLLSVDVIDSNIATAAGYNTIVRTETGSIVDVTTDSTSISRNQNTQIEAHLIPGDNNLVLKINAINGEMVGLSLYSVDGQKYDVNIKNEFIDTGGKTQLEIDVSSIPRGIYCLSVLTKAIAFTKLIQIYH